MTEGIQDFRFRDNTRAPFEIAVRLRFDRFGGTVDAFSADVSLEGMFVRTDDPKAVGTLVQFEFGLGEGEERDVVQGLGDVVWLRSAESVSGKAKGMGIQFRYIDPHSRDLIHRIVSRHLSVRPTSADLPIQPQVLSAVDDSPAAVSPTAVSPTAGVVALEPAQFVPALGREDSGPLVFPAGALDPNSPVPKLPVRAAAPPAIPPAEPKDADASFARLSADLASADLPNEDLPNEDLASADRADEATTGERPAVPEQVEKVGKLPRPARVPIPLDREPPPVAAVQEKLTALGSTALASSAESTPLGNTSLGNLDDILGTIARDSSQSPSSSGMTTRSPFKPPPPDPDLPSYLSPSSPAIGRPILYAAAAIATIALATAGWWYRDALLELLGVAKEPAVTQISLPAARGAASAEVDPATLAPPVADPLAGVATTADTANPVVEPAEDGVPSAAAANPRGPADSSASTPSTPSTAAPDDRVGRAPAQPGRASAGGVGSPSRIDSVFAQETATATILVITADRPIQPGGFSVLSLSAPPRFVLKLQGIEQPFADRVPSPRLRSLRSAVHRDAEPTELHLVFDLAGDRARATARLLADGRLEVRLEDG